VRGRPSRPNNKATHNITREGSPAHQVYEVTGNNIKSFTTVPVGETVCQQTQRSSKTFEEIEEQHRTPHRTREPG